MTTAERFYMLNEDRIMEMDEEDRAKLAAMLLNEIDPGKVNLELFFDELDDIVHDELCNRASDRDYRN